jgi:hypothetical protein
MGRALLSYKINFIALRSFIKLKPMKKLFAILLMAAISCNRTPDTKENKQADTLAATEAVKTQPAVDVAAETEKLNSVLRKFESKPQTFTVSASKKSAVTGKKGTLINIDPANLETEDGKPLGKNIEVELKELTNQFDLLKANAQTMSDGRLLVSGGAYNITMTSDGSKLRIKNGKTLKVQFPVIANEKMSLFYGQHDSLGHMNWEEAKQEMVRQEIPTKDSAKAFVTLGQPRRATAENPIIGGGRFRNTDPMVIYQKNGSLMVGDTTRMTKEERQKSIQEKKSYENLYATANISRLGWFNCDRLLNAEATNVKIQFPPSDSVFAAKIFLVFKNINSVVGANYFYNGKESPEIGIASAPVGYKAMLLAYTVKGEKIFADASDITVEKDMTITPKLRQMSEDDFGKLLNGK